LCSRLKILLLLHCLLFTSKMPALTILEIHEKSFEINFTNFSSVLDKVPDLPIVIISLNGCMREGKSYIHSYFMRYLKNEGRPHWFESVLADNEMFSWRSGSTRETVGINIWSEPFITQQNGRDVAVLLLDCQGLFDPSTTYAQNAAIYAFSSLLSSVMIYNVKTKIEEDLLQKILLFSDYTDSISSKNPEHQDTKPYFLFLLRDFEFVEEFDYGFHNKKERPKRELENPGNYFDKIFTNTEEIHDKNQAVRVAIQNRYKDIGMFVMPHPGGKFIRDSRKNPPEQDFQNLLKELVVHIMSHLVTKRIGKEEVSGKSFKTTVKHWADLCKDSNFPVAETFAETTTRLQNDQASTMAIETFKMKYTRILYSDHSGVSDEEFRKTYPPLLKEVIETYKSSRSLGGEDLVADYVSKLTEKCELYFEEHCLALNAANRKIKEQKLSQEEERKKLEQARLEAENKFNKLQAAFRVVELLSTTLNKGFDMAIAARKAKNVKHLKPLMNFMSYE
ncbi:unnamed protein product, partial [Allacma fusca]